MILYTQITNCTDWKTKELCKNANQTKPLVMPIPKECKVMVVSQAPSRSASELRVLADRRNRTFGEFLSVLKVEVDTFHRYFYWTHYGKCYPGARKGGDQWPTVYCAEKYMEDEIRTCRECGLSIVIGISEPSAKFLYTRFVDTGCKKSEVVYKHIRNIRYEHDNVTWMFIKHTASTALWARDHLDREFVLNVLQPEIQRALC